MRVTFISTLLLAAAPALAQYSEGWKPGQARSQPSASVNSQGWDPSSGGRKPPSAAGSTSSSSRGGDTPSSQGGIIDRVLTSGPLAALFSSAGVNITEKLAEAHAAHAGMWDMRIPLIHDGNYESLVVNETFASEEEERERTWFIIITAQASSDTMSKFADQRFDELYNYTLAQDDLPYVKFARIDYLNTTYITTKWNVWRAPYYVILKDRGTSLRFYRSTQLRGADTSTLHRFLKEQAYLASPPWSSAFAPGGPNEKYLHYFARANEIVYDRIVVIPRWLFITVTGLLGTMFIQLIHAKDGKKAAEQQQKKLKAEGVQGGSAATQPVGVAPTAASTSVKTSTETPKKRKTGKK